VLPAAGTGDSVPAHLLDSARQVLDAIQDLGDNPRLRGTPAAVPSQVVAAWRARELDELADRVLLLADQPALARELGEATLRLADQVPAGTRRVRALEVMLSRIAADPAPYAWRGSDQTFLDRVAKVFAAAGKPGFEKPWLGLLRSNQLALLTSRPAPPTNTPAVRLPRVSALDSLAVRPVFDVGVVDFAPPPRRLEPARLPAPPEVEWFSPRQMLAFAEALWLLAEAPEAARQDSADPRLAAETEAAESTRRRVWRFALPAGPWRRLPVDPSWKDAWQMQAAGTGLLVVHDDGQVMAYDPAGTAFRPATNRVTKPALPAELAALYRPPPTYAGPDEGPRLLSRPAPPAAEFTDRDLSEVQLRWAGRTNAAPASRLTGPVLSAAQDGDFDWLVTPAGTNRHRSELWGRHRPSGRWLGRIPLDHRTWDMAGTPAVLWLAVDWDRDLPHESPLIRFDLPALRNIPQTDWLPAVPDAAEVEAQERGLAPRQRALRAFFRGDAQAWVNFVGGTPPDLLATEDLFLLAAAHDPHGLNQPGRQRELEELLLRERPDSLFARLLLIEQRARSTSRPAALPAGSPAEIAGQLVGRFDADGDGALGADELDVLLEAHPNLDRRWRVGAATAGESLLLFPGRQRPGAPLTAAELEPLLGLAGGPSQAGRPVVNRPPRTSAPAVPPAKP